MEIPVHCNERSLQKQIKCLFIPYIPFCFTSPSLLAWECFRVPFELKHIQWKMKSVCNYEITTRKSVIYRCTQWKKLVRELRCGFKDAQLPHISYLINISYERWIIYATKEFSLYLVVWARISEEMKNILSSLERFVFFQQNSWTLSLPFEKKSQRVTGKRFFKTENSAFCLRRNFNFLHFALVNVRAFMSEDFPFLTRFANK